MSAGHVHYYDIDGGVPRVLGVTTRFTLAEHSGEGKIDGDSGRVMSHGKGWVPTGMFLKKDVERRRVIIRGRIVPCEHALTEPPACAETSSTAALKANLFVYHTVL